MGSITVESAPSKTACVTPADTFAPAAPRSIAAVASEGAIGLIWEPNTEGDLAGYLVLRGEAPGEKLQALTPAPITETTYRDTTIKPGVAYVYAVVAIDKANNMSAQSDRITEKGR
jgi:fibronectin type 3 domain-containing protein